MKITVTKGALKNLKGDLLVLLMTRKESKKEAEKKLSMFDIAPAALKDFNGKAGESLLLYQNGSKPKSPRVLLLGLGDAAKADDFRKSSEALVRRSVLLKVKKLVLDCSSISAWSATSGEPTSMLAEYLVDAAKNASYRFDRLKSGKLDKGKDSGKDGKVLLKELCIRANAGSLKAVQEGVHRGSIIAEAGNLVRDLVNMPGNLLNAEEISEAAEDSGRKSGCKVTVYQKEEIEKLGMGGLLAVNKGSKAPPTFTILDYKPHCEPVATVAIIGKGVTFDSGGISLKPASGMGEMKCDMAGGATVIGTLEAAARLELPVRVLGLIPATDNMPGGAAQKPGDVITTYSGITVEVGNTDAEGRLILADALTYAVREYKPDTIIDLATLTGACIVALGYGVAGMFSNDDSLAAALYEAGKHSGDKVWRMPLWEEYDELIKSEVADVHNIGGKGAGAVTAAKFLEKFTEGHASWAHLDIAGPAFSASKGTKPVSGGTGFGVRLLLAYLRELK